VHRPSHQTSLAWLKSKGVGDAEFCLAQAGDSPLLAMEINEAATKTEIEGFAKQLAQAANIDPFSAAAHWGREGLLTALILMQKWIYDLLSTELGNTARYYPNQLATLKALVKRVEMRRLLDFQRQLTEARAYASHPLNAELQLEALLLRYSQIFKA
jgi:DNA polymerase-3 subunit delta'